MSYILEALKKIEQKREESPRSVTFSAGSAVTRRRLIIWPYLLIAALLINAGFLLRWMWPEKPSDTTAPAEQIVIPHTPTQPSNMVSPVEEKSMGQTGSGPVRSIDKHTRKPSGENRTPSRPMPESEASQSLPPVGRNTGITQVAPEPEPHAAKQPPSGGKTYNLSELPTDVRRGLPEFRISGHAYSPEPQTRVVRINEKILQEGQDLASGVRVEEIVPAGVILSYQGYRFRVGISQPR
jgi:general secretion pathway protein B